MTVVKIPALGAAIVNVTIVQWLVAEGDPVKRGDAIVEVETDKMNMEIPAERDGVLHRILAQVGATTQEGDPLAIIGGDGEDAPAETAPSSSDVVPRAAGAASSAGAPTTARPLATPSARRVARALGVDLALVRSARAMISEQDVRDHHNALGGPSAADHDTQVIPLVGARKLVAERMVESFRTIPHYTMTFEVGCERLVALRAALAASARVRLTFTPFIVKAIALAVRDEPIANATLVNDEIRMSKTAHVGVAVAAGDVIVVPVLRHPIRRGVLEIAAELAGLTELGRERRLTPDAVAGATITLSNVGATEIVSASTIINPPQVAMIAVTRIVDRVTALDGAIAIRPSLNASFTYDHRVVQGIPGARFAARVKFYLEHPDELDG